MRHTVVTGERDRSLEDPRVLVTRIGLDELGVWLCRPRADDEFLVRADEVGGSRSAGSPARRVSEVT